IERIGLYDTRRLARVVSQDDMLEHHCQLQEFLFRQLMTDASRRFGRVIDKQCVIFDCTGMGLHQLYMPAMGYLRAMVELDSRFFPERLERIFLVNAPTVFSRVWQMVRRWLDKGVLDKVHILGSDFKDVLLKYIDPESLPEFLGGTCTCSHMPNGCVPITVHSYTDKLGGGGDGDASDAASTASGRTGSSRAAASRRRLPRSAAALAAGYSETAQLRPNSSLYTTEVAVPLDELLQQAARARLAVRFATTRRVTFEVRRRAWGADDAVAVLGPVVVDPQPSATPALERTLDVEPGVYELRWSLAPGGGGAGAGLRAALAAAAGAAVVVSYDAELVFAEIDDEAAPAAAPVAPAGNKDDDDDDDDDDDEFVDAE
ncbi:hypothetical protein HK405_012600, partial [Cladochytrium tenue]